MIQPANPLEAAAAILAIVGTGLIFTAITRISRDSSSTLMKKCGAQRS
jgi:hypothetical protein